MPRHAVEQRTKREIVEDLLRGPTEIRPDFGALPVAFRLSGMSWGEMQIMSMLDNLKSGQLTIIEAEIIDGPITGFRMSATNLVSVNKDFTLYKARDYLHPQSDEIESIRMKDVAERMSAEVKSELAAALLINRFRFGEGTFNNFERQYVFEFSVTAKKADEGYDVFVADQYMTNTAFIISPSARRSDYVEMLARFRKARNKLEFHDDPSRD